MMPLTLFFSAAGGTGVAVGLLSGKTDGGGTEVIWKPFDAAFNENFHNVKAMHATRRVISMNIVDASVSDSRYVEGRNEWRHRK